MDKIIRISSVQGQHDRSGNKNLVDYHIPANSGVYNLKDSYIAVNVSNVFKNDTAISCDGHTGDDQDHVKIVYAQFQEDPAVERAVGVNFIIPPTSAVLIKNAQMVCSAKGQIESIRRVDMLRANQYSYVRSKEALFTNPNSLLLGTESGAAHCLTRQPYAEMVNQDPSSKSDLYGQPVRSIYRDSEIRIPLKEIFNFCQVTEQYDSAVYGSTHINLEFQFEKLIPASSNTNFATTRYRGVASEDFLGAMEDNTTTAAMVNVNRMMTKNTYGLDGLELSPFYIGMKIKIDNSASTNNVQGKISTITSIVVYDGQGPIKMSPTNTVPIGTDLAIAANKGKLLIEIDGSYINAQAAGQAVDGLFVTQHDLGGTNLQTLTIQNVDLVAKLDRSGESAPKQIEYTKFDIEDDTFEVGVNRILNRYYDLPPNCDSVWLLMTSNKTYAISAGDQAILTYRITIDNVELSNRDIEQHSQLHKDLISRCLRNQGLLPNSMEEEFVGWNFEDAGGQEFFDSNIIGIPVPNIGRSQRLGVEIVPVTGDTFQGFISLYKHRAAVI